MSGIQGMFPEIKPGDTITAQYLNLLAKHAARGSTFGGDGTYAIANALGMFSRTNQPQQLISGCLKSELDKYGKATVAVHQVYNDEWQQVSDVEKTIVDRAGFQGRAGDYVLAVWMKPEWRPIIVQCIRCDGDDKSHPCCAYSDSRDDGDASGSGGGPGGGGGGGGGDPGPIEDPGPEPGGSGTDDPPFPSLCSCPTGSLVLACDDFNDTPGVNLAVHEMNTGQKWQVVNGRWHISADNRAFELKQLGDDTSSRWKAPRIVVPTDFSDVVVKARIYAGTLDYPTQTEAGLLLRFNPADNSGIYCMCNFDAARIDIWYYDGVSTGGSPWGDWYAADRLAGAAFQVYYGDVVDLTATISGDQITFTVDAVSCRFASGSHTITATEQRNKQMLHHGLWNWMQTISDFDNNNKFDAFSCCSVPPPDDGDGTPEIDCDCPVSMEPLGCDSFTDDDATAIGSHTPDGGNDWSVKNGDWKISSNALYEADGHAGEFDGPRVFQPSSSNDVRVTVAMTGGTTSGSVEAGVILRYDADTESGVYCYVDFDAGTMNIGYFDGTDMEVLVTKDFSLAKGDSLSLEAIAYEDQVTFTVTCGTCDAHTSGTEYTIQARETRNVQLSLHGLWSWAEVPMSGEIDFADATKFDNWLQCGVDEDTVFQQGDPVYQEFRQAEKPQQTSELLIHDTFDDDDNTTLPNHTPNHGTLRWTAPWMETQGDKDNLVIISNAAVESSHGNVTNGYGAYLEAGTQDTTGVVRFKFSHLGEGRSVSVRLQYRNSSTAGSNTVTVTPTRLLTTNKSEPLTLAVDTEYTLAWAIAGNTLVANVQGQATIVDSVNRMGGTGVMPVIRDASVRSVQITAFSMWGASSSLGAAAATGTGTGTGVPNRCCKGFTEVELVGAMRLGNEAVLTGTGTAESCDVGQFRRITMCVPDDDILATKTVNCPEGVDDDDGGGGGGGTGADGIEIHCCGFPYVVLPTTLYATITDGTCSDIVGTVIPLTYTGVTTGKLPVLGGGCVNGSGGALDDIDATEPSPTWQGEYTFGCGNSIYLSYRCTSVVTGGGGLFLFNQFKFTWVCNGVGQFDSDCSTWKYRTNCSVCGSHPDDLRTCDPFQLHWDGPRNVTWTDPTFGPQGLFMNGISIPTGTFNDNCCFCSNGGGSVKLIITE